MMLARNKVIVILLCLVVLTGCKVKLNSGLNEAEANVMLATLLEHNIPASKAVDKDGIDILVDEASFGSAVQVLESLGLPNQKFESVNDVFNAEGIVASPLQEWAKLNYAQSQGLAKSIAAMHGVIDAHVHIAQRRKQDSFDETAAPMVSVLVKVNQGLVSHSLATQIKELVIFSVPDVSYERVGVVQTFVETPKVESNFIDVNGLVVEQESAIWVKAILLGGGIGLVLTFILGGVLFFIWFSKRSKKSTVKEQ